MGEDEIRRFNEITIRHDERLEVLENNWAELRIFMDSVTKEISRLSNYNSDVANSIRKAVFGNGQPGLCREVGDIKAVIEARKGIHDKEIGRIHGILCWGGIALFSVMAGTIGWLIPTVLDKLSK